MANEVSGRGVEQQRPHRRSAPRRTAGGHPTLKANLLMAGVVVMLLLISVFSMVGR
jgi:hypothetical protein